MVGTNLAHVAAPLKGFETAPAIEAMLAEMNSAYSPRPTRRFPTRYLRYWFMRHVLHGLHATLNRPLDVLEVGIGYGKMLAFMNGPQLDENVWALPPSIAVWDALSGQADPRTLRRYSYSSFQQVDFDKPFDVPRARYDAIIALHVLEHLLAPETTMQHLLPALRPRGVILGGSPTMPDLLGQIHERYLRRINADKVHNIRTHKHLSVISPRRIRRFAKREHLRIDLLAGAFLMRSSSNPLEDRPWWMRMNLAWGALFPSLGGEVYFALRRDLA
jgi:2-polyprenyl-3-methyl-5-hydroxy-6-metoxy-1,4-benzoquinol methylase